MPECFLGHWGRGTVNSRLPEIVDSRPRGNEGYFPDFAHFDS